MTKAELIVEVQHRMRCSRAEAKRRVDAVFDAMETGIRQDGFVKIAGFGRFDRRLRKGRSVRHPKDPNRFMEYADRNTVKFTPADGLRDRTKGIYDAK